jgi:peptidyl-prolyl cis-trans isomerase D
MIQSMREMAQGTVARILIGIIIVLLLLFGYGSFDILNTANAPIATVNGHEIDRTEYEREIELQRRMSEGEVDDAKLRSDVLETMIKRALLLAVGADLDLSVNPADVDQRIVTDQAFIENGKFSPTLFQQRLAGAGLTPASYRVALTEAGTIEQLQYGIADSEFLTPVEMRRIEALVNQQRDVAWVDVDPASFAAQVQVDDAAVRRYFDANARRFQIPESVIVDYLRVTREALGRSIAISPADIAAEYQRAVTESQRQGERRHVAHIMLEQKPGRSQAQAIAALQAAAARIAAGESFADVAKAVSEDASSKELGGDLGFVGKGELPEPALDAAIWKLAVGQVSAPVVSGAGVHLLTVLEAKAQSFPALAEVQEQLRTKLQDEKVSARLASVRGELTELAYEQDLPALAKRYGVPVERSGVIPRAGVVAGIGGNPAVRAAAFSNDLRDGAFNSPVLDVEGDLVVLRLVKHQDARPMTYAEAMPQARAMLMRDRQVALATQRAEALVKDVQRTGSLTPSIQALAVTWQSRAQLQRAAADVPPEVLQAAFELPRPAAAQRASGRTVTLPNGHVAAVVVTRVVDGLSRSNGAEQAGLRQFLTQQSGQRQFGAYIERLEANADIERTARSITDETGGEVSAAGG